MAYRIGVDVGGTFTDLVLVNEVGRTFSWKTPSTPNDPSLGVARGITEICERSGVDSSMIHHVMHGTTVATNAVLEGRGARVGLLCTEGFEQVLHLARGETPGPLSGWVSMVKPEPLAALEDTRGIPERMSARGEIIRALDEDRVREAIVSLAESGVESLSVSLINAYANPMHEQQIAVIARELYPNLPLSLSSSVLPEFREYERTLVTVMNSYIRPTIEGYMQQLAGRLASLGMDASISILGSSGGLMTIESTSQRPVHAMLSGPAGGVKGAASIAHSIGIDNFLTVDVGGTSTDVALCLAGTPVITRETTLGYFPIKVPSIDVRSVGAGGGSIAHVPEVTRALRVGPESAGAHPGPAAYGSGGDKPTVTDAHVVLGHLPSNLLGGTMQLDIERARAAIKTVADDLDLSIEEAAEGIIDIVNENMVGALRLVSVEKGYDPREFALIAFGGAGPLHGNAVAALMGCFPIIIPQAPGVLCALGDATSEFRREFSETFIQRFDATRPSMLADHLTVLATEGLEWLEGEGVADELCTVSFEVDVRYVQQGLETPVSFAPEEREHVLHDRFRLIRERFEERHEREYGFRLDSAVEFVNLRCIAVGDVGQFVQERIPRHDGSPTETGRAHRMYHRGEWLDATVYDRSQLPIAATIQGPAVITQLDSTTVLLPGYSATIDSEGNLIIARPTKRNLAEAEQGDSPIIMDIVENALKNIRREMDSVIFRTAMSTVIREEHDSFPLVTDEHGRMLAGQFGWPLEEFFAEHYPKERLEPGDVLILNDPYLCGGAVQHTPDLLVLRPIFVRDELVGFSSQLGNLMDIGGPTPGSMPAQSRSIFEEGIRFPPVKLYKRGELDREILGILARNSRTPELVIADTMALCSATRVAEQRVIELCERFGVATYRQACEALLGRTHRAAKLMIRQFISEDKLTFEDVVDDDGRGNGPFRISLAYWREGEKAIFDFTGTSPQAAGPINLFMGEPMFKMVTGIILIMALDPQILYNHGYYDLFEIRFPKGSVIQPYYPAPLANRAHTLARIFDVLSGGLAQQNPELSTGAGCGSSPHFLYSGRDTNGEFFFFFEINYGGIPGRPAGDGMDVHAWWPHVTSIPVEYAESYYPIRIERLKGHVDSGGAGRHRGGNGVEKLYTFLAPGQVSIHDDRWRSHPWGIGGGGAASCSRKLLIHRDGTETELPSKVDFIDVEAGDQLLYITAGGGGWLDPLSRPAEQVRRDVRRGFVSRHHARDCYGVALDEALNIDPGATAVLRERLGAGRPWPPPVFDRGASVAPMKPEPPNHVAAGPVSSSGEGR